jgi:hypothetical protein
MKYIQIGRYQFNVKTLKENSLKDAIKLFNHIDKRVVENAYRLVNPKRKIKKKTN